MNTKALYKISYGLYIVSSKKDDKFNAQIANTLIQVTSIPLQVLICINKENLTYEFITESKIFNVSILSENTPLKFIGNFGFKSGREIDKFKDVNYKIGKNGAPIVLDWTIGYLECEVVDSMNVGTHTIFIGKVTEAELLKDEEPMTYAYYHTVKGGKSPKTAPTYIEERKEKGKIQKYKCTICGYVYDPEKGDPDSGIKQGTPFEELPDDWTCPVCGAGKEMFEKEE